MNDKPLIYLFISLPADDDWEKERTRIEYTIVVHKPTPAETTLFTACTEPAASSFLYSDEYNTRGGGSKSAFADYMLGRYKKDGCAEWKHRYLTPALTNIDSFWHDEIVQRWPKLPKHDVMVIAPEIKECYDLGEDYVERLDNLMLGWCQDVAANQSRKLSSFEMDALALHIDDFRDEPSEDEEDETQEE